MTGCWPNFPAIGCALALSKLAMCMCHIVGPDAMITWGCITWVCDWDGDLDIDLYDVANAMNCTGDICGEVR